MPSVQAKVPYRVPLVGGFTDFPEFYKHRNGQTIAFTINKFLTVSLRENNANGIDINSASDLPYGIGLGSSGAYHAALVSALAKFKNQRMPELEIARLAYELETGIQKHSTGRQDSLACLCKSFSCITYLRSGNVSIEPTPLRAEWRVTLNRRLLLFDTGVRRMAADSIKDIFSRKNKRLLNAISRLPATLIRAWRNDDIDFLATAINLMEEYRSRLSPTCRSVGTDRLLRIARECGAGARLAGAGLGCLLCYCAEDRQQQLRARLRLPEISFSILW